MPELGDIAAVVDYDGEKLVYQLSEDGAPKILEAKNIIATRKLPLLQGKSESLYAVAFVEYPPEEQRADAPQSGRPAVR